MPIIIMYPVQFGLQSAVSFYFAIATNITVAYLISPMSLKAILFISIT